MKNATVPIVLAINILLVIGGIIDGSFSRDSIRREENTKTYNGIVKVIKSSKAEYKVLSGRLGGTFSFKITPNNQELINAIVEYLDSTQFKRMNLPTIIYCDETRGIRLINKSDRIILEYERGLPECKK